VPRVMIMHPILFMLLENSPHILVTAHRLHMLISCIFLATTIIRRCIFSDFDGRLKQNLEHGHKIEIKSPNKSQFLVTLIEKIMYRFFCFCSYIDLSHITNLKLGRKAMKCTLKLLQDTVTPN